MITGSAFLRIIWVFYGDFEILGFQSVKRVDNNRNYGIINLWDNKLWKYFGNNIPKLC